MQPGGRPAGAGMPRAYRRALEGVPRPRQGDRRRDLALGRRSPCATRRPRVRRQRHRRDLLRGGRAPPRGRPGRRAGGARREDVLGLGDPFPGLGARARAARAPGDRERRDPVGPRRGPGGGARGDSRRDRRRACCAPASTGFEATRKRARDPRPRAQGRDVPHGFTNGRRTPARPPTSSPERAARGCVGRRPATPGSLHRAKLASMRACTRGCAVPSNVEWLRGQSPSDRERFEGGVAPQADPNAVGRGGRRGDDRARPVPARTLHVLSREGSRTAAPRATPAKSRPPCGGPSSTSTPRRSPGTVSRRSKRSVTRPRRSR